MDAVIGIIASQMPLNVLNVILNGMILALMWKWIKPELSRLADEVGKTNGSVKKLLQWKEDHTDSDDDRHRDNQTILSRMADSLRDLVNRRKP